MTAHLDDETLDRLNALALAPAGGGPPPLDCEIFRLTCDQHGGAASLEDSLIATDVRSIGRRLVALEEDLGSDSITIAERAGILVRLLNVDLDHWASRRHLWQRELSQLLVRYPVLLDHRLAFGGYTATFEAAPLPHLLAYAPFASLPRLSDGVSEDELRRFASLRCVKNGLTRPAPGTHSSRIRLAGRSVTDIAFGDASEQAAGTPIRGRMVTSLLQLSEFARQEKGRGFFAGGRPPTEHNALPGHVASVFWDVAAAGGAGSGMSRCEFRELAALVSPQMSPRAFCQAFEPWIGAAVGPAFGSPDGGPAVAVAHKAAGVRNAIGLLVEIGAKPDPAEAARWLSSLFGGLVRAQGAAVSWQTHEIIAVLEVLDQHGARMTLAEADIESASPRDAEAFSNWRAAIELHAREADMCIAIAARAPQPVRPTPQAPARRRARSL